MKLYDQAKLPPDQNYAINYFFAISSVHDLKQSLSQWIRSPETLKVKHDDLWFQRVLKSSL
jgi:hypothetical protein